MRRIIVAAVVVLAALHPVDSARAGVTQQWSYQFSGKTRFAHRLDASERGAAAIEIFNESGRVMVSATGVQTPATYVPVQLPNLGCSPSMMTVRSPRNQQVVVFGAGAKATAHGFELPIPSATRYSTAGTALATYAHVMDGGFLTDDGATFVTFSTSHAGHVSDEPDDIVHDARFFDASGNVIGRISDPEGLYHHGALSADGTLLVHPRTSGQVVGYSRTGQLVFTHPIPATNVGGLPGIAMTPTGSFIAFQVWSDATGRAGDVRVINRAGNLVRAIPDVGGLVALKLSDDGSSVLTVSTSRASLHALPSGSILWTRTAPPHFAFTDADHSRLTKVTALVAQLDLIEPYVATAHPDQYFVEVIGPTGTPVGTVMIPRPDDPASGPPTESISPVLSDDGALLLVHSSRWLGLYAISH